MALDTMVREELGLDPDELGSPWGAALVLVRRLRDRRGDPTDPVPADDRTAALVAALVLSFTALFAVGAAVSMFTGRGMLFSGARQVAIGAVAAAVTYAVGTVIGVNVA